MSLYKLYAEDLYVLIDYPFVEVISMVNYLAVLVAGVVNMAVGAFWYSPVGFGKMWMRDMKYTAADIEKAKTKGMGKSYALAFLAALVMAYVLSVFLSFAGAEGVAGGMITAVWLWLGFTVPLVLGGTLWEQKSWTLFFIGAAYWLVVLLVNATLLTVWV
jgi:hypothetical protein